MMEMKNIWTEAGRPNKWKYLLEKIRRDGMAKRYSRSIANETERYLGDANVYFKTIDIDNDNFLTTEEAQAHFEKHTGNKRSIVEPWEQGVKELDVNKDGMISPEEFDESLKNM